MRTILIFFFSVLLGGLNAQDLNRKDVFKNEGLFAIVKTGFGVPLNVEWQDGIETTKIGNSKSSLYFLDVIGGYYLIPELSLGIGVGLEGFHNPSSNTFPLYGDIRYYSEVEGNSWYASLSYGRNLELNNTFRKGELIRLGLGYKFFTGKVCWLADMHYGQYDVSLDGERIRKTQHSYSYRQTLGFSIGLMF